MTVGVHRLLRIERTVSDLSVAVGFYGDALDFTVAAETRSDDPVRSTSMGVKSVHEQVATLRLGEQEIALTTFDPPGRAYPPESGATDCWFQHLAIVVSDMDAAYARLCRHPFTAITQNGPQRLPPNTGSVTAFKFRDPDGHPLELIHFPPGTGDPIWQRKRSERNVFLGVDHSALTVADTAESIDFYTRLLGLEAAARSTNAGAAQARLDNLPADVRVNVVALQPQESGPPHIELLDYERPAGRPFPTHVRPIDILADRLVLEVDDLSRLKQALAAENIPFTAPDDGRCSLVARDPTGHMLLFTQNFIPHETPVPETR